MRHDERLVPRLGPPGLRLGGPDSARGPAGEYRVSALHVGSASCVWEWLVGLVSSVDTFCFYRYLDWGSAASLRTAWLRYLPVY